MYESGYANSGAEFGALVWLIAAAVYLYVAFAVYKIAQKCKYDSEAWWGFVPILNVFLLLKCAGREWYWFFGFLVPIVNIVITAIVWMDVARNVGKSPAWGIMMLLPFINFVAVGIIAFTGGSRPSSFPPPQSPQPKQPANVG